ncbi:hypothetical protein IEQ34_002544 [Dendrobium chrysotoxum]|uniref:Uncharacterized protein n=1 Tax=Dendrobium chrysotoxum TaxID=161865 RepID=A0AAV7HLP3_DENCH|nr:hypothetical protein IEQ34_002544 [Dendrobium chrysotoxum]
MYDSLFRFSEDNDKADLIEGKVDWKGNPAKKGVHGGISSAVLPTATFGLENLASASVAVNLITYLITTMHYDLADASNLVTNFTGTGYILSVLIAIFADTFIHRYKVICLSTIIEILGLGLLSIQAHHQALLPPPCKVFDPSSACVRVYGRNEAVMFVALYLTAFGSAGVKAAVPPHCADQFDEKNPREARQISSFFNWLLLSLCIGGAISLTVIVWIQDEKGFAWGFTACAAAVIVALFVFACGIPRYRIPVFQKDNAFLEIFQVLVAAMRNRKLKLPDDPSELYEIEKETTQPDEGIEFLPHRDIFRSLDKAAIRRSSNQGLNKWKLCRVTQVENAKIIVALLPIFCSTIIMSTCLAQLQTFSIHQGSTMNTRISNFHIPSASLPIFPLLFMLILIPIYDRLIVPFARRLTGLPTGITHFQRIGVGLVLACLSMATAALVEVKRKHVAAAHGMLDAIPLMQPLPISIFWLNFQYFIFGMADIFTYVGLLEFFYSEAPKALKSFASSFLWCSLSLGYFFSTILVNVVNAVSGGKGKGSGGGWLDGDNINRLYLDRFYWLLAGLCFFNFFVYLFCANWYQYRPRSAADEEV